VEWLKFGAKKVEHYNDLNIMADPGLHQQVFSLVDRIKGRLGKNSVPESDPLKILDVAAGAGAFSKRLLDHGYSVEAVDIDRDNFIYLSRIPFHKVDLNDLPEWDGFVQSHRGSYDIVVSQETIEHLENPWSFLRGLKELAKPEGYIILTTPNIESPWSKFIFILRNKFFMFTEGDLQFGHVSPLTSFEISTILGKNGMEVTEVYPGGSYPLIWIRRSIVDSVLWCGVNLLAFPFTDKVNLSTCKIYLIQRSHP
jgi:2-polyprenyl-3-methyl-5-hydroxy-6-metoxy-1,4-benzoquinol methylase